MRRRFALIGALTTGLVVAATVGNAAGTDEAERIKAELDRQPVWNEKPFAPADATVATINPPAFVWLPLAKRPKGYVLAVSRSESFQEGQTTLVENVPISVHVPTEPMDPGTWHWRTGVRTGDGFTVWGKTRSFTIAGNAQVWPLPKIEQVAADIPHEHPRLLFVGESLQRAREACKDELAGQYAALLRSAERCLGEELVPEPQRVRREERGSGSAHDYVAIFRSTRPPMNKMEQCALAYVLSGDERFGQEAKRRILHFFSWDPEGSTNLFHNDEPAMWVMQRGIRAYDWTYDLFTPEERTRVEAIMKARAEQFVRRLTRMPFESRPYSSHPARDLGFLGEAAICFVHEWPEARDWLQYVTTIYWSVFPAWAQDDGGWQEGPGYWRSYMSFALHFVAALEKASGTPLADKPFFRNTPYYKLYTNPPYAKMSPYGDGQHGSSGTAAGHLLYHFSTLVNDPYLRWYPAVRNTGSGSGPLGFALADATLEARPPSDLPQALAFDGAGLVAMHADLADPKENAYLVMRSSPFGSVSHGHADQNAFAIEAYGEALAIASGYYPWYSSAHHHNWTRATKATNNVTFDGGQGQTVRKAEANGQIVRFLCGEQFHYALGDATPAYSGRLERFQRHVIHVRPGTFVIVDELAAPAAVEYEWWLHALDQMQVNAEQRRVMIRRGDARLSADFVEPTLLQFHQTGQFDPPPENKARNQWHLTATIGQKRQSAVFLVVLQAHRADQQPSPVERIEDGGLVGAGWQQDGVECRVLFDPGGVRFGDVATDGRLVAVCRRDADATAWLAVEASKLTLGDRQVFQCESPITATWSEDASGGRLVCDGPAAQGRIRLQASPTRIERDGREVEVRIGGGAITLDIPPGRSTTDVQFRAVDDSPAMSVVCDGAAETVVGRRYNRMNATWRYDFKHPPGTYQLSLPEGTRLIVGVQPVRGDTLELRGGETLWWYGPAAATQVALKRIGD